MKNCSVTLGNSLAFSQNIIYTVNYAHSVTQSCPTVIPWTLAHQAPLSMEFSRLPLPPPGDLSDSVTETSSLALPALAGKFFTTVLPAEPQSNYITSNCMFKCLSIYPKEIKTHPHRTFTDTQQYYFQDSKSVTTLMSIH